jgi:DNA-binding XRE family transcriptional regulator
MGPQRDFLNQPPLESKSLRRLRLRAGLSQGQLAGRLGVTCYAIRAWEKGQEACNSFWTQSDACQQRMGQRSSQSFVQSTVTPSAVVGAFSTADSPGAC